jgi:hypothetical protein
LIDAVLAGGSFAGGAVVDCRTVPDGGAMMHCRAAPDGDAMMHCRAAPDAGAVPARGAE